MGTLPRTATVEVVTAASPEQVWDLLADITRAGEWSHETRGGTWIDGATAAAPGARFRGNNRYGRRGAKWTRTCEIEAADRPSLLVWRTIPTRRYPDSTRWRVEIGAVDGGTRIVQRFVVLRINPIADRLFYAFLPAHRDRRAALTEDLRRLGEVAARTPVPAA
jgi:uncharacterized protein YndB with AHSA1/START domain